MNAVSTSYLRCVAELMRAQVEHFAEQNQIPLDDVGSIANLQSLRRVYDIVGGQTVVEPTRGSGIADGLADIHSEGNDVVFDAGFEFVNARNIHSGARANDRSGVFGHEAGFGQRLRGGQLDLEPFLEAIRIAPDLAHLFAGVTWDQIGSLGVNAFKPHDLADGRKHSNDTAF